jgi:alkylhydroperoxidase/carboxymuconolactone decarboxylase family protein YurZ
MPAIARRPLIITEAAMNSLTPSGRDFPNAPISPKLKALLTIAAKVQQSGKQVTAPDVAAARAEGANDLEIHDTVLIGAAFCMFSRCVDGLATFTPHDEGLYDKMGERMAGQGYGG